MKQSSFVAVAMVAIVTMCGTGCKTKQSVQFAQVDNDGYIAQVGSDVFRVNTIAYDSVGTGIKCNIRIGFPNGDDNIAETTKQFIARELASICLPNNSDEADEKVLREFPIYRRSVSDGSQMVDYYGDNIMRYLQSARKELEAERIQKNEMPILSQQIRIDTDEITPSYITYYVTGDNYLGGAHHTCTYYCRNISRKTNKIVDSVVDTTRVQGMQPLLRENVLRCLKASGVDAVTDTTLKDFLILPDDEQILLPIHEPWLEHGCVKFVYQPYEIASYAVGSIIFSVPVKEMMPYLTEEARELLKYSPQ